MSDKNTLEKLQRVIDFVWDSKVPLYREHWKKHGIVEKPRPTSLSEFNTQIPNIKKEDLEQYPHPDARCYIDKKDVRALVSTSGTTSGKPFFRWHTHHNVSPIYERMYKDGCRTELYCWSYHRSGPLVSASTAHTGIQTIVADPRQGDEVVRHLESRSVELISSTPSVALMLADRVKDKKILDNVLFLMFIGEFLTPTTLSFIKAKYPNARVYNLFGFSESGCNIMVHKPECDGAYNVMHVEATNMYVNVEEQDLLSFTTLEIPHPTPLIRYVSGDAGARVAAPCGCGDTNVRIELLGREFVDFVRIQGVEIQLERIEYALRELEQYLESSLNVIVRERVVNGKTQAHLTIEVVKKPEVHIETHYLQDLIKNALMNTRLSPQTTLRDAITAGRFAEPDSIIGSTLVGKEKARAIRFET